jgi:ribosomal protein L9
LDSNLLTKALKKFYDTKEDIIALELVGGGKNKKKKSSNFENEKENEERKRKQSRLMWERLASILSEQKLSVWRSLDKSMTKYYSLLVDRQNLIEETGLLNQQNEELKTLLN